MIHAVIQILINDTGVKTAVGLNKEGDRYKVMPVAADQDEVTPFTVASMTSVEPDRCKDVASRMDKVFFRLISYTKDDYEQLDKIDNQIRFALDNFSGVSAGIELSQVRFAGAQDLFDNTRGYYARASDYWAFVRRKPL